MTILRSRAVVTLLGCFCVNAACGISDSTPAPSTTTAPMPAVDPLDPSEGSLTRWVDPLIGVRDSGSNCVIGPQLPSGSINPSPDSPNGSQDGYMAGQPIRGISQLHATGTGWGKYGQFLISPQTGLTVEPASHESPAQDEIARPYAYGVTLSRYAIRAEVAPAHFSALYRLTFPAATDAHVLIDIRHNIPQDIATQVGGTFHAGAVTVDSADPTHLSGWGTYEGGFGSGRYTVYFSARLSRAPLNYGTWNNGSIHQGSQHETAGENDSVGVFVGYATTQGEAILLKIGVSFKSESRADDYLAAEIPAWDFDAVRRAAERAWDDLLGRVRIEGGTDAERTLFYSALYRSFEMPRDRTGDNPKWDTNEPYWDDHYAVWDTWRTVFPLQALIRPDAVASNIRSFVDRFRHNGFASDGFVAGNDMRLQQGGDNIDNIIADGFVKGVPGVDWTAAYALVQHDADQERLGFIGFDGGAPPDNDLTRAYKKQGWIPAEANMSCSYTLEFAYNDFCAARLAQGLGHSADAERYARRARSWENIWSPQPASDGFQGWIAPRNADGTWRADDPKLFHGSWVDVFYEGSGWTYSFFAPQDFAALIQSMGGGESFAARLEHGAQEGLIDYSNEPGFMALRAFHYALRPDRCSYWVRDVMTKRFSLAGYPGNEDSGAMGSWYVFSALGFFPNAGQDVYLINGPLFQKATLTLGNGKTFVVQGVDAGTANPYIQSCTLNGAPLVNAWFTHAEIANGGTLRCVMGPTASAFGQTGLPPPSLSTQGIE